MSIVVWSSRMSFWVRLAAPEYWLTLTLSRPNACRVKVSSREMYCDSRVNCWGRHHQALDGLGVDGAQDAEDDPDREHDDRQPEPAEDRVGEQRDPQQDAQAGRDVGDRDARVDVGVAGAPDVAVVLVEEVVLAHVGAGRDDQGDHREEDRDVGDAAVGEPELEIGSRQA